jgi:hypothetical protein
MKVWKPRILNLLALSLALVAAQLCADRGHREIGFVDTTTNVDATVAFIGGIVGAGWTAPTQLLKANQNAEWAKGHSGPRP